MLLALFDEVYRRLSFCLEGEEDRGWFTNHTIRAGAHDDCFRPCIDCSFNVLKYSYFGLRGSSYSLWWLHRTADADPLMLDTVVWPFSDLSFRTFLEYFHIGFQRQFQFCFNSTTPITIILCFLYFILHYSYFRPHLWRHASEQKPKVHAGRTLKKKF